MHESHTRPGGGGGTAQGCKRFDILEALEGGEVPQLLILRGVQHRPVLIVRAQSAVVVVEVGLEKNRWNDSGSGVQVPQIRHSQIQGHEDILVRPIVQTAELIRQPLGLLQIPVTDDAVKGDRSAAAEELSELRYLIPQMVEHF